MGYTTNFSGEFKLNKQLTPEDKEFLTKLANTRRMKRNIEGYGVDGEFYVDGEGFMGQDHDDTVVDSNVPPSTQPGLWCQWTPTEDGWGLEWDQGEKFYNYVEWLEYIIDKILIPRGYVLNGEVEWEGEESGDLGKIKVVDNKVEVYEGQVSYEPQQPTSNNHEVWMIIHSALMMAGFKHNGGGDGTQGFEDEYQKGDYKVTIGMRN